MEIELEAHVARGIVKSVRKGYESNIWHRTYYIEVDNGKSYHLSGRFSETDNLDNILSKLTKLNEGELKSFTLESFKSLDIREGEEVIDIEYHVKEKNDDNYVVIHRLSSTFWCGPL